MGLRMTAMVSGSCCTTALWTGALQKQRGPREAWVSFSHYMSHSWSCGCCHLSEAVWVFYGSQRGGFPQQETHLSLSGATGRINLQCSSASHAGVFPVSLVRSLGTWESKHKGCLSNLDFLTDNLLVVFTGHFLVCPICRRTLLQDKPGGSAGQHKCRFVNLCEVYFQWAREIE